MKGTDKTIQEYGDGQNVMGTDKIEWDGQNGVGTDKVYLGRKILHTDTLNLVSFLHTILTNMHSYAFLKLEFL